MDTYETLARQLAGLYGNRLTKAEARWVYDTCHSDVRVELTQTGGFCEDSWQEALEMNSEDIADCFRRIGIQVMED